MKSTCEKKDWTLATRSDDVADRGDNDDDDNNDDDDSANSWDDFKSNQDISYITDIHQR